MADYFVFLRGHLSHWTLIMANVSKIQHVSPMKSFMS